jgi:kinesin family protein C2/C3
MASMFKKLTEKASNTLSKTLGEPIAFGMGNSRMEDGPTEAGVYKSLLVEMQYNQLLVSREYQELFKTKQEEINRLKKLVGETIEEGSSSGASGGGNASAGASSSKPLHSLSPEDIKLVLKEWERKMKNNIVQKTEALAEAQIYRESVELLRAQLDSLKEKIQEQEKQLNKKGGVDHYRADLEAGMTKLVAEFEAVQQESQKTKDKLSQAELEIAALRQKIDSDAKTIEILSKSAPGGSGANAEDVQKMLQQREDEWNKVKQQLIEDAQIKQSELEAEMQALATHLEESKAKEVTLNTDLQNALAIQAEQIYRAQKQAEDEIQNATGEKEAALNRLKEGEVALKEALEKLAKTEADLQRITKDHQELVGSLNESSKKDLQQKESALETLRLELEASTQKFNELRTSSEALLAKLKGDLEGKDSEIESLKSQTETLEGEKTALAAMAAKNLEEATQFRQEAEKLKKQNEEEFTTYKISSESEVRRLQADVSRLTSELGDFSAKNGELVLSVEESSRKIDSLKVELTSTKQNLEETVKAKVEIDRELELARKENVKIMGEISELKQQLNETAQRIQREVEKVRNECLEEQKLRLKEQADVHAAELAKARKETAEFKDLYVKETVLRRQVHDELMDLKGNIRVFARVRPVLPDEKKMAEARDGLAGSEIVTEFPPESMGRDLVIKRDGPSREDNAKFEFDMVFDPDSKQEQVFETVAPLIVSVMDGVNVTLFAYGQTGSGKTFTMEGTKENPGVNIRALQRVFEIAEQRSTTMSYTFAVSVLEVYLETILDLLGDVTSKDAREKLDIRQNPDTKQVFVQGLIKKQVTNMKEVEEILQLASKNRTVGAHNMNEHSSRSHLVFTLTCAGASLVKKERFEGNLNLIDLAGSERVGKTEATGDRLKEAQSINKSLSALGDVINALSLKNGHIPFRNSKLTYLLQDQLSGNAKVGFFANVSPTAFNSGETLCTLNFANRCRKTELGKARKNVVGGTEQLQQEIARLRKQVEELQGGNSAAGGTPSASTPVSTPQRGNTPVKSLTSSSTKRGLGDS